MACSRAFVADASTMLAESLILRQENSPTGIQADGYLGFRMADGSLKYVYPVVLAFLYAHCPLARTPTERHLGKPLITLSPDRVSPLLLAPFLDYCMTAKLPVSGVLVMLMARQLGTTTLYAEGVALATHGIANGRTLDEIDVLLRYLFTTDREAVMIPGADPVAIEFNALIAARDGVADARACGRYHYILFYGYRAPPTASTKTLLDRLQATTSAAEQLRLQQAVKLGIACDPARAVVSPPRIAATAAPAGLAIPTGGVTTIPARILSAPIPRFDPLSDAFLRALD